MPDTKLKKSIGRLDGRQSNDVVLALKEADIVRLMRNVSINTAIKIVSKSVKDRMVKNV